MDFPAWKLRTHFWPAARPPCTSWKPTSTPQTFSQAVDLLRETDCIWIAASRRSFPIAVYLDYALQHTDKRVHLMSGLGNMHLGQMRSVREGDVMLAISFSPYAEETITDCP